MKSTASTLRRALASVFATCALGGAAAAAGVPAATAAPDPCAAGSIARSIGTVSTDAADYLDDHPETNDALTAATQQPAPQAFASLKSYFDANPDVAKDLQVIQQPLTDLSGRCPLPITMPQALQALQAIGQGGGLPGSVALPVGLPDTLPSPQSIAVPAGTGPLPGPAVRATPGATGTSG